MELKEKIIDEKTGIEYKLQGDYYIPNIQVPKQKKYIIGKYGNLHLKYIREHKKYLYNKLLFDFRLNEYLHELDKRCYALLDSLTMQLAEQENVTEELKATNQLEWVQKMNNIKNRVEEIILNEYVYN